MPGPLPSPGEDHTFAGIPEDTLWGDTLQGGTAASPDATVRGTRGEMEGGHGSLTWGSCLWAKVSCTGSCSPEMLVSPTVMPTTVLSRTCPVWLSSCVGTALPEPSRRVASVSGQKDAGNASLYLKHAKLLDVEDCHHHTLCLAAQGLEYLLGELDFACLPLLCHIQCRGALRWRTAMGGCLLVASPLCSGPTSLAPGTNSALPG